MFLCPQVDAEDQTASDLAMVLFETATLRSGFQLADTKAYGDRIERMLRLSMNVDINEQASDALYIHHSPYAACLALQKRILNRFAC